MRHRINFLKKIFLFVIFMVTIVLVLKLLVNKNNDISFSRLQQDKTKEEILSKTSLCKQTSGVIAENVVGLGVVSGHNINTIELLEDLGVKWIRVEFHWNLIEQNDGNYNWEPYDNFVKEMQKRDIRILGIINYIPWTYSDWESVYSGLRMFSNALVERYKPNGILAKQEDWNGYGVSYWEFFNEPNLPGYGWLDQKSEPRQYVDEYVYALALANAAIRDTDENAIIVLGGLSPEGMPPDEFLAEFYNFNAKNCFDVLAFHPYGFNNRFNDVAAKLRELISQYDDEKPIWFNEYGTPDDLERAELLTNAFAQKDSVEGFFWFSLRDLSRFGENYGLVEFDYSKKQDYFLFKELLKRD